ncbi:MAG: ABC transporter permease [Deltaproteobacteria bacterium]|nr:ABC transporter permease [Deltaproteobacteria bacterium]
MRSYILKKTFVSLITVFGAVSLVFFIIHLIPGDPVESMLGEQALSTDKEKIREVLGLNKPLISQYFSFIGGAIKGDLGESLYRRGTKVSTLIAERFPNTFVLAISAMFIAVSVSVFAGIIAAIKRGTIVDTIVMSISGFGISIPTFFLGPLLLLIFCRYLKWLPPPASSEGILSLILPSLTLGFALSAFLSRLIRSQMLEVLSEDYIRTAYAKGLPKRLIIFKHALSNILVVVITIVGMQFGSLLTGAIITERVFAWQGIGTLMIEAITKRDYPVVQGCIILISTLYVIINLITDIFYAIIDPRIRYAKN